MRILVINPGSTSTKVSLFDDEALVFEESLFRANRTTKKNAEHFEAFDSFNYPSLAKAGVHIIYRTNLIHYPETNAGLITLKNLCTDVAVLKLFPGIQENVVRAILNTPNLKGLVLETYGSGNAPSAQWLYRALKQATDRGIIIVNKTQCSQGSVDMGQYEVAQNLLHAGVLSGYDITTEALLTKMMVLFGEYNDDIEHIKMLIQIKTKFKTTIKLQPQFLRDQ